MLHLMFLLEYLACPVAPEVPYLPKIEPVLSQLGSCQNVIVVRKNRLQGSSEKFRRVTTCCGFSWLLIEQDSLLSHAGLKYRALQWDLHTCVAFNPTSLQSVWLYRGPVTSCLQILRFGGGFWWVVSVFSKFIPKIQVCGSHGYPQDKVDVWELLLQIVSNC